MAGYEHRQPGSLHASPDTNAPRMIRAFLFDIGNVLLKFDFSLALRKLAEQGEVNDPVEVMARIDQIKAGV